MTDTIETASAAARKDIPIATGVIDYFPDALVATRNAPWPATISITLASLCTGIAQRAGMKAMH